MQHSVDVNGNGIEEEYILEAGVLRAFEQGEEIWRTSKECDVYGFAIGDLDRDGQLDVAVSLWRRGSFGRHRPFWEKGPDYEYKNHLYIYRIRDGVLVPMWFSSALPVPIVALSIREEEGETHLIVEEGRYKKKLAGRYGIDERLGRRVRVWRWDEWGFSPVY